MRRLGVSEPSIILLAGQIAEVRARVMDDPLGLDPDAGFELDQAVADAALAVGQLRRGHDELDADLARTDVLVARARTQRAQAAVALAEAQAKILSPTGLATVPAEALVDEIARRAAHLRVDTGNWQQRRADLDSWLGIAERLVGQLGEVVARNRHPLERRDQLRGLLSAYRAKAAAVGLIEQAGVGDVADEAHSELYTAPTDLGRGAGLVATLAELVRSQGSG